MIKIDKNTWPRRELFDFFSGMSNPFYMVTFKLDVTKLYLHVKKKGISFYYALVYLCTKAINEVEAFHYIAQDGDIYRVEQREPSFTDIRKGSELFYIVTMPCKGDMEEFCRDAARRSSTQECFINSTAETEDLIYFSCLPWVDMTAMVNERDLSGVEALDDSIPRICWGKYTEQDGRKTLGISVELNHRFTDGVHIGMFAQTLERMIEKLE